MSLMLDPTFCRSPAHAIAAPPERLAYVAAFDPVGKVRDAMTVVDCDPSSPSPREHCSAPSHVAWRAGWRR
jgi:selenium-binding protein 1